MSLQTAETEGDGPWPFLDVVGSSRLYFPCHLLSMLQYSHLGDVCSFVCLGSSLVFLTLPIFLLLKEFCSLTYFTSSVKKKKKESFIHGFGFFCRFFTEKVSLGGEL